jgi:glutamyl-tRNA reductase
LIIERETAACYAQLRHQQAAGMLLQQLGSRADAIRQRELDRLFATHPELASLAEADRDAIAHMASRLQNQLLHHPRAAVKSAVAEAGAHPDHATPHPILTAVRHLFGLGDGPSKNSFKKIV